MRIPRFALLVGGIVVAIAGCAMITLGASIAGAGFIAVGLPLAALEFVKVGRRREGEDRALQGKFAAEQRDLANSELDGKWTHQQFGQDKE